MSDVANPNPQQAGGQPANPRGPAAVQPNPNPGGEPVIPPRAILCEALVKRVIDKTLPATEFVAELGKLKLTAHEMEVWVEELETRIQQIQLVPEDEPNGGGPPERPDTPDGLEGDALDEFRKRRDEAVAARQQPLSQAAAIEQVLKQRLQARVSKALAGPRQTQDDPTDELDELLQALAKSAAPPGSGSSSYISSALLSAAPHLAAMSKQVASDPLIEETCRLRRAYAAEKNLDSVVDLFQMQPLVEPLPRPIWKQILGDEFVDFRKLHAAMDGGHNEQYEEARDFGGGYAIFKKDHLPKSKDVKTESEWQRVFAAWSSGVVLAYPHRQEELNKYRLAVEQLFRIINVPASTGIEFDVDLRRNYTKSRFRLDNTAQQHPVLLARLFEAASLRALAASRGGSSSHSSSKRGLPSNSTEGPSPKKATSAAICRNWNLGFCVDPCGNGRRHGACIECGESHKAKDITKCKAALEARK
ncbi:hypothetical protein DFP72DRAFT_827705 [Ephemerocybe angulata]|uniref:Uncharacterized protein n=1 Tax=Ephemerocybe angulata TaxID=980116 RepID=A0A8H6HAI8_9AGAR|nr:hypothetical protein DFP72DRAFT_827705 [Tulosesus angulatus]